jgi:hypothetical protein
LQIITQRAGSSVWLLHLCASAAPEDDDLAFLELALALRRALRRAQGRPAPRTISISSLPWWKW